MDLKEVIENPSKYSTDAWGYLLSLDCSQCDKSIVKSKDKLKTFAKGLVGEIDMVPHGPLMIEHFPQRDKKRNGISFVQLIETSSITGHFVDVTGDAYIDIFTCKELNVEDAVSYVKKYLKPKSIKITFETRNA